MNAIEQLISDRAESMAAHDGFPVSVVHLHGAANQLQAELISARDRLIHALLAPAAASPIVDDQPSANELGATEPDAEAGQQPDAPEAPAVEAEASEAPAPEAPAPEADGGPVEQAAS